MFGYVRRNCQAHIKEVKRISNRQTGMKEPDHRVTFAVADSEISKTPSHNFHSEVIGLSMQESKGSLIIGEYEFESSPQFGSKVESEGRVVFDKESELVAVTTQNDRPKPRKIFEALEDALGVNYRMPDLEPEDEHNIYRQHGFDEINGYTISFKENSETLDVMGDLGRTLDPEDKAEERTKFGNEQMSRDLVDGIAREAMKDGMYIWSCDLIIEDYLISYSDPLVFIGISDEFLDEIGFEKLFGIGRGSIT